jgi:hypothetical protein
MERYFTNTKDVFVTDEFCEGLLRAIIKEAPKVFANPEDYEARANIMWAGTMAHNDVCGVGREEDWTSHGIEHELSAIDDNSARRWSGSRISGVPRRGFAEEPFQGGAVRR